jgi:Flp pilus assembly secretin CpaC
MRQFISCAGFLAACLNVSTDCSAAEQLSPLTVERSSKQQMVLTQGFSTTIHSERPLGKVSITDPDVVDLVLRTDKTATLIPQRLGRTNIDFLDDHGSVIGRGSYWRRRQNRREASGRLFDLGCRAG